jgi:hypothetical protein
MTVIIPSVMRSSQDAGVDGAGANPAQRFDVGARREIWLDPVKNVEDPAGGSALARARLAGVGGAVQYSTRGLLGGGQLCVTIGTADPWCLLGEARTGYEAP